MKDYVILVDETNTQIGKMEKLEAHNTNTPLHRGFSIFLFTKDGDLLLQRRSAGKKTWPLIWSNSCCGHPKENESVLDAGRRRLKFELGLKDVDLTVILPDYRYRYSHKGIVENEICPVMVGIINQEPKINKAEVSEIQYVNWTKFLKDLEKPNNFSEWCVEEATLLSTNPSFLSFLEKNKISY